MSKKISIKALNKYLSSIETEKEENIVFEYGTAGKPDFTVELRPSLNPEMKGQFISLVADTIFSNGNYQIEYIPELFKIAFFKYYVLNIDEPVIDENTLDTDKVVSIVDGLNLLDRYFNTVDGAMEQKEELMNAIYEKISYNREIANAKEVADRIFENIMEVGYGISEKLQELIEDIDVDKVEALMSAVDMDKIKEAVEQPKEG